MRNDEPKNMTNKYVAKINYDSYDYITNGEHDIESNIVVGNSPCPCLCLVELGVISK